MVFFYAYDGFRFYEMSLSDRNNYVYMGKYGSTGVVGVKCAIIYDV